MSIRPESFSARGALRLAARCLVAALLTPLALHAQPSLFTIPGNVVPTGSNPVSIATGDFNHDGILDFAVANTASNNVNVFLGAGGGVFTPAPGSPFDVGNKPSSVAAGDFDRDGNLDLVVVNSADNTVSTFLGDGTGAFTPPGVGAVTIAGTNPQSIAVGDFNRDGWLDLALAAKDANTVTVLLGQGLGRFGPAPHSPFRVGTSPFSVIVADFNRDGKPDLAVANYGDNNINVLLGDGAGGFTVLGPVSTGFSGGSQVNPILHPYISIAPGDFNNDGLVDLAIGSDYSSTVTILLGDGAGGFRASRSFGAGNVPQWIAVADFDGDGNSDLAIADWGDNGVTVLLGDGNAGFTPAPGSPFPTGSLPVFVTAADLNGDGQPDLAVANFANQAPGSVSVLLNGLQALSVRPNHIQFAAGPFSPQPPGIPITVSSSGSAVPLSVSPNQPWLVVDPSSDVTGGTSTFTVFAYPSRMANSSGQPPAVHFSAPGYYGGTVKVAFNATTEIAGAVNVATTIPVDASPRGVVSGDFDGDGIRDLAVVNQGGNSITVLRGDIQGGYTPGNPIAIGQQPSALVSADFNGDGIDDLAAVNTVDNTLTVLLGSQFGSAFFQQPLGSPRPVGSGPVAMVTGDFNADGIPDLAIVLQSDQNVRILLGIGGGRFVEAPGSTFPVGTNPSALAIGDFNGDGKPDLAVTNQSDNTVTILLGDGAGAFVASGFPLSVGAGPDSIAVGDFDRNGTDDLAVANHDSSSISLLLGDGNGGFTPSYVSPIATGVVLPGSVVAGDFDGDGSLDLAVGNADRTVALFIGDGFGAMTFANDWLVAGTGPHALAPFYGAGDGKLDLAIVNTGDNSLTLAFGGQASTATTLFTTSPNPVPPGQNVHLLAQVLGRGVSFKSAATIPFGSVSFFDGATLLGSASIDQTRGAAQLLTNPLPAGTHNFTATYSGEQWNLGSTSHVLALGIQSSTGLLLQTITFNALADQTYGAAPFAIAATATSGLPVTFTPLTPDICTISKTTVTLVTTGTCSIVATQPGSLTYSAAAPVTQSFVVKSTPASSFVPAVGSPLQLAHGGGLVQADFNNDGKPDFAVYDSAGQLTVYLGDGAGGFSPLAPFASGLVGSIAAGDFNNDGRTDLMVLRSNDLILLLGNGSGGFTQVNEGSTPFASGSLVVGDFNNDGNADVAYLNANNCLLTVLFGDGAGGLVPVNSLSFVGTSSCGSFLASGEFNGDGKLDLAMTDDLANTVTVLFGDGAGGFTLAPGSPVPTGATSEEVTVADFNGDGKSDLAVSNYGGASVTILLGDGTGRFTSSGGPYATGDFPRGLAVADFNGDGHPDLVVGNQIAETVRVLVGDGAGGFSQGFHGPYQVGLGPDSLIIADFNGDGRPDVAVASSATQTVTVLLGSGVQPQFITFSQLPDETFGNGSFTLTATASSGLPVSYTSNTPAVCTVSGSTLTLAGPGSCSITAGQAGNANYGPAQPVTESFHVLSTQTITFSSLSDQPLASGTIAVTATASSGLPVAFGSNTPAVCTVSGNSVTLRSPGTCSITATQSGNSSYAAAPSVTQSFTVTGSLVTLTINETVTVTDSSSFPDLADSETITITDQVAIQVFSPTTTSIVGAPVTGAASSATVSVSSATGAVSGNVTLTVDGGAPSAQPLSGGSATFNLGILAAGSHSLAATFSAQENFLASSAQTTLTVAAASTVTLTSSPNPSAVGRSVTFTANIVGISPTGTVVFLDGTTTIGTAAVTSGSASFTTSALTLGSHSTTAIYSGDPGNLSSTSATHVQTVNQPYVIVDLGTLGGTESEGLAINNNGQITGDSFIPGGDILHRHAFVISAPYTAMIDLGTFGGTLSNGRGINNLGQVVGAYDTAVGGAFLLSPPYSSVTDLGTLSGFSSVASGINDSGAVTGWAQKNESPHGSPSHAFLWDGTMHDLGTLVGDLANSYGHAINASGQVTGSSDFTGSEEHLFLWDGTMHDLGTLGGGLGVGASINNSGQITGYGLTAAGEEHAFLWDGSMHDLGTLSGGKSDGVGINASGQIVGVSQKSGDFAHAFLYTAANGMVDLNDLLPSGSSWRLLTAYAINDAGQITGNGLNPSGANHAYLLTPPPPPMGAIISGTVVVKPASGTANAVFPVTFYNTGNQLVPVNFNTADGTAVAGRDYGAASGTLTFGPGVTTQNITVQIIGGGPNSSSLLFSVRLTSGGGSFLASGTGTIVSAPPPPRIDYTLVAAPASLAMIPSSSASSTIILQSKNGISETAHLSAGWKNGAAPAGVTFSLSSSDVTIPPGSSSAISTTLTVTATASAASGNYVLTLTATSATGVTRSIDVPILVAASLSAPACGCTKTGPFVSPRVKGLVAPTLPNPNDPSTGIGPGGFATVTTSQNQLTLKRNSDGRIIINGVNNVSAFGFSPNGKFFVLITQPTPGAFSLDLYSIPAGRSVAAGSPLITNPLSWGFSPDSDNRYFVVTTSTNLNVQVQIYIYDTQTGALVMQTSPTGYSSVGNPAWTSEMDVDSNDSDSSDNDQKGGWGFGPDGKTFVVSYRTDQNTYWLSLFNLTRNTPNAPVIDAAFHDVASFWQFSPCGDLFMWVHQAGANPSTSDFVDFLFTSNGHSYKELNLAPTQGAPSASVVANPDGSQGVRLIGMSQASVPSPQCTDSVTALSPVNITLSDATGRRTGFDSNTGGVVNQIPGGSYTGVGSEPQTVSVPYVGGAYVLDAYGLSSLTSPQPYTLIFAERDASGDVVDQTVFTGMASRNLDQRFAFAVGNGPIQPAPIPPTVVSFNVLFGSETYNVITSSRVRLPWQIAGIQVVFSEPISSGGAASLSGATVTGFSGLGTNTLTWTISPVALGNLAIQLSGSGANALATAAGAGLGSGAGFTQNLKILWGDFNDDGAVSASDLLLVNRAISSPYSIFADMNGDGVVNLADVQVVRARAGTSLP